jgi:hypothetical protein
MNYLYDDVLIKIISYIPDNMINISRINKNFYKNVKKCLRYFYKKEYIQDIYCNFCKKLLDFSNSFIFSIKPCNKIRQLTLKNYPSYIENNDMLCYRCLHGLTNGKIIYRYNNKVLEFFVHVDGDFFIFVTKHTGKDIFQYQYVLSKYYNQYLLEFLQEIF